MTTHSTGWVRQSRTAMLRSVAGRPTSAVRSPVTSLTRCNPAVGRGVTRRMPSFADYSGSRPGDPLGDSGDGVDSLAGRIAAAASFARPVTFVLGGEEEITDWGQIHHQARGIAAALQARGIGPGDHVALLSPTTRPLVAAIQATWLAGATLVVLPL